LSFRAAADAIETRAMHRIYPANRSSLQRLLLSVSALFGCGGCASWPPQQAPATPQRPTLSSDTNTTAHRTVEVEAGVLIDRHDEVDTPLALKWGMEENTELFASWSPFRAINLPGPGVEGVGDLSLGLRHRFADESETTPSGAFQLSAKLPTGESNPGPGTGETDLFAALIAGKSVGRVSLVA
jgi:hypothetical protein